MTALALLQQWEAGRVRSRRSGERPPRRPRARRPARVARTDVPAPAHAHGRHRRARRRGAISARPMIGLASTGRRRACPQARAERYGGRLRARRRTRHEVGVREPRVQRARVPRRDDERRRRTREHMRSVLFDPLGMDHTDVVRSDRVVDRLATGYGNRRARSAHAAGHSTSRRQRRGLGVLDARPTWPTYAGRAARRRSRHREAGRRSRPRSSRTIARARRIPGIGLSFFRDDLGGRAHRRSRRRGARLRRPSFAIAPDDGVGVVAFTNGGGQAVAIAGAAGCSCALLGVDPGDRRVHRPLRPERWADLVGYYRPDPGPLDRTRACSMLGGGARDRGAAGSGSCSGAVAAPRRSGEASR